MSGIKVINKVVDARYYQLAHSGHDLAALVINGRLALYANLEFSLPDGFAEKPKDEVEIQILKGLMNSLNKIVVEAMHKAKENNKRWNSHSS